ncbi:MULTISPECIES: sulfotransferase family protein [Winogradskyella]|uniref:sulfotransferase family protein n=1 Tax=Winogradskyella TaxID=286104 RepID=UPI000C385AE4|nr:sulfotransferase [Winogradskyella sp. MH6]MAB47552.1 hypothetical protein [Flavobacteriaceae bacterium]MBD10673.1 hypothetical protein [Flavobacteriaceae bacterium]|tara:strand:- start:2230 stop:3033 length:804 start_codon:yes stop_codon:yes gene_type:complete
MTVLEKIKIIVKTLKARATNKIEAPIFIIGTGRCGSDLMVDVLETNPGIQIDKNEQYDWFLPALFGGKERSPMLSDLINYRLTAKESLKQWTAYYRFKLKLIIENKINANNKVFILKSPAITFLLDEIDKMFPDAKYIHLYRNGFSVSKSWCTKEYPRVKAYQDAFSEEDFLFKCAEYYNDSIIEISNFLTKIGKDRQHSISYEDFCENPKGELSKILQFVNVNQQCTFDLSKIVSTNHKVNNLNPDIKLKLNGIMSKSLTVLGYKL